MIELNRLYNADYLDGIKDIDDKSIDLIVTDPRIFLTTGIGISPTFSGKTVSTQIPSCITISE